MSSCPASTTPRSWQRRCVRYSTKLYRDVEFLVLDDCSTDQTFAVIRDVADVKQFRRRFRRLEMSRNQQNQGAHHSLNLGLAAARGEFVTFINSDDRYEPNGCSF